MVSQKAFFCFDADDFQRVEEIRQIQSTDSISVITPEDFQNKTAEEAASLLKETDLTVVFIGKHTFKNDRCLRLIGESFQNGNAFLAVYLNNAEDVKKSGKELLGKNPFELFYFEHVAGVTIFNTGPILIPSKLKRRFSAKDIKSKADFVAVYDYIKDNGVKNFPKWMEEERRKKTEFWTECDKIKESEWEGALKITCKGNVVGFFLYYHWLTYTEKNPTAVKSDDR